MECGHYVSLPNLRRPVEQNVFQSESMEQSTLVSVHDGFLSDDNAMFVVLYLGIPDFLSHRFDSHEVLRPQKTSLLNKIP